MRVGLVIYGSLDTLSGGYLYDRKLVEYLRSQGDTIEVLSQPWRSYPRHLLQNFDRAFARRMAALDVDVLLQDELNHPSLFLLNRRLKPRLGYPLVSIVHHLRSSEQHPRLWNAVYRRVERDYLRGVSGFVFNSRTTAAAVEALRGSSVPAVIATPGGDRFGSAPAFQDGSGPLRILFLGNLIPRKGLHTLLEALALLPEPGWRLDVVGQSSVDTAYTRRVQALAAPLGDRVRFHGRLDEGEMQDLWQGGHLLAVPSSYEGFGIVYLEGMSFGLPAVGTTAGAAAEIIQDGVSGILVSPDDPPALAARLLDLARDRARLSVMRRAARHRFEQFPTWEQSMQKIRQFLLDFTGGAA